MPSGELVPVTMMTLPCTRLRNRIREANYFVVHKGSTYGALESAAIEGIFGISSNMPGSSLGLTSCSDSCCARAFGDEDIVL